MFAPKKSCGLKKVQEFCPVMSVYEEQGPDGAPGQLKFSQNLFNIEVKFAS